jgi:transposase
VKLAIIKFYHEEPYILNKVGEIFNVQRDTIKDWQNDYLHVREKGLERLPKQNFYSKEVKLAAVQDYLCGD